MFESCAISIRLPAIETCLLFLVFYPSFIRSGGSLIEFLYEQLSNDMIAWESQPAASHEFYLEVLSVAQVANLGNSAGLIILIYWVMVSTDEDFTALLWFAAAIEHRSKDDSHVLLFSSTSPPTAFYTLIIDEGTVNFSVLGG